MQLRNSEVEDLDKKWIAFAWDDKDVVGLEIAMHDPQSMRGLQCACDLDSNRQGSLHIDLLVLIDIRGKAAALQEFHRHKTSPIGAHATVEDLDNIFVLGLARDTGLGDEASLD